MSPAVEKQTVPLIETISALLFYRKAELRIELDLPRGKTFRLWLRLPHADRQRSTNQKLDSTPVPPRFSLNRGEKCSTTVRPPFSFVRHSKRNHPFSEENS